MGRQLATAEQTKIAFVIIKDLSHLHKGIVYLQEIGTSLGEVWNFNIIKAKPYATYEEAEAVIKKQLPTGIYQVDKVFAKIDRSK